VRQSLVSLMSQGNLDTSHRAGCRASLVPRTSPTDPTMGPNATSAASRCEAEQPAMRCSSGMVLTDPPCSTPTPIAPRPACRKDRCFMLLGEDPPGRRVRRRSPKSRDAESCGPAHRRAQGSPRGDPAGAADRRWCGAAPTSDDLRHMIDHHRPVSIHHLHQLQGLRVQALELCHRTVEFDVSLERRLVTATCEARGRNPDRPPCPGSLERGLLACILASRSARDLQPGRLRYKAA
jgi:hypothetical protein